MWTTLSSLASCWPGHDGATRPALDAHTRLLFGRSLGTGIAPLDGLDDLKGRLAKLKKLGFQVGYATGQDPQVTGESELEPGPDRVALHRRDGDDVRPVQPGEGGLEFGDALGARLR